MSPYGVTLPALTADTKACDSISPQTEPAETGPTDTKPERESHCSSQFMSAWVKQNIISMLLHGYIVRIAFKCCKKMPMGFTSSTSVAQAQSSRTW